MSKNIGIIKISKKELNGYWLLRMKSHVAKVFYRENEFITTSVNNKFYVISPFELY